MSIPKHIIEVVYGVLSDNNLSRILPVLDENIVLYISEMGTTGSEYYGRSGFLNMMSGLYTICDNLRVNSLVYFTPDTEYPQDKIVTTGYFEGKLLIDNQPAILPFVHYWQLNHERVVELRAFSWDSEQLLNRLQPEKNGTRLLSNGYHDAANGSHKP